MRTWGCTLVIVGISLIAIAAVAQSQNTTISKDTTVSWEIVVLLIGLATTATGSVALLRAHAANTNIHPTAKALDETYLRNDVFRSVVHEITGRLDEIATDVREIKGALQKDKR